MNLFYPPYLFSPLIIHENDYRCYLLTLSYFLSPYRGGAVADFLAADAEAPFPRDLEISSAYLRKLAVASGAPRRARAARSAPMAIDASVRATSARNHGCWASFGTHCAANRSSTMAYTDNHRMVQEKKKKRRGRKKKSDPPLYIYISILFYSILFYFLFSMFYVLCSIFYFMIIYLGSRWDGLGASGGVRPGGLRPSSVAGGACGCGRPALSQPRRTF